MDAAADVYQQAGQPEIEHRDRDGTGKLYESHWGDSRKLLRRREWLPIKPTRGRCCCCCCVLQRDEALQEIPVTKLTNQLSVGQTITHQYDTDGLA